MSETANEDFLAQVAEQGGGAFVDATNPEQDIQPKAAEEKDDKLDGLLARINSLASHSGSAIGTEDAPMSDSPISSASEGEESEEESEIAASSGEFVPHEPTTLKQSGLTETEVESLVMKYLLSKGDASGHEAADQVGLPFALVEPVLQQMKFEQLLAYRGSAAMNDYIYQLTDNGRERARRYSSHCTYFGSAPVALKDYIACVKAQSIEGQHPTETDLKRAFEDLLINPKMLSRLGPAINSGRGMFLFGYPGNGKTSIAERVTGAFGKYIWIPRALGIDGEIMRLFDPMNHEEAPLKTNGGLLSDSRVDKRWVRIKRPTIVVGGELTMDNLEVTLNTSTGISEAPMQLKSNCGTLVIDDFGRQRMSTDELLNRWIVPLEKRYDFLNLANGKKIQVPFDQLVIFSTNLEPKDLVDDAFLRRIPYKIEVEDPSEDDFRELFKIMCPIMGLEYADDPVNYLIETHYKAVKRPFRCCQPRDLLLQVRNNCLYLDKEIELTRENFDFAVGNYFAVM